MRKLPQMNVTVTKLLLTKIDRERDRQWARGRKMSRSEVVRYLLAKGLSVLEGGRD
jgi:Arc/MetJ-type ribon-helix-helix transcriptional regulator